MGMRSTWIKEITAQFRDYFGGFKSLRPIPCQWTGTYEPGYYVEFFPLINELEGKWFIHHTLVLQSLDSQLWQESPPVGFHTAKLIWCKSSGKISSRGNGWHIFNCNALSNGHFGGVFRYCFVLRLLFEFANKKNQQWGGWYTRNMFDLGQGGSIRAHIQIDH